MDPSSSQSITADDSAPPQFSYEAMNGFEPLLSYGGVLDSSPSLDGTLALGLSLGSISNADTELTQRRLRNETEQKRREVLRDAFKKLKDTLPATNQKSSKMSLLDQAVAYVRHLEEQIRTLQTRLDKTENELNRQRNINEGLIRAMTQ